MSSLVINCPHCNRSTPVELGTSVMTTGRCRHCGLVIGESEMVVGGRKPLVRKKVSIGSTEYGSDNTAGGEGQDWEANSGKQRRFKFSAPLILMMILAPVIAIGGVAFLLKEGYIGELERFDQDRKNKDNLKQWYEKYVGERYKKPEKLRSTDAEVVTGNRCFELLKAIKDCETPDELLQYVRTPENVKEELLEFYANGRGPLPIGEGIVIRSDIQLSYDEEDRIVVLSALTDRGEPWWCVFQEGIDLRLDTVQLKDGLTEENYLLGLPSIGYNLVNIIKVGDTQRLHIRIFKANGEVLFDKPESELDPGALAALKSKLDPFPERTLPMEERWELVQEVAEMTDFEVAEEDRDLKLDWKSFVRYSGEDVFDFLDNNVREPTEFRVLAMIDDYPNYKYTVPEWLCVQIFDPELSFTFYGYAKRQSSLGQQILDAIPPKVIVVSPGVTGQGGPATDVRGLNEIGGRMPGFRKPHAQVTLKVAFPTSKQGANQVEIIELVRESWYVP